MYRVIMYVSRMSRNVENVKKYKECREICELFWGTFDKFFKERRRLAPKISITFF